jgi:hypothetical protein
MHRTQVFIDPNLGGFLNLFVSKNWNKLLSPKSNTHPTLKPTYPVNYGFSLHKWHSNIILEVCKLVCTNVG